MQDNNKNKFSFINEKRKEKPINKKKLLIQSVFVIVMAVVFGLVASFVFTCTRPGFEKLMYPEDEPVVKIPQDHEGETQATETEEASETEKETDETPPEPSSTEMPSTESPSSGWEIELEDYQKLQNKLYDVGREASRFVVTVTGVKSDTDWFNNPYESKGQASGIIIANTGKELLIMTERKVISDAQEIFVTFINETTVAAGIKKYDGNTGISILSVPIENVDAETTEAITVAKLGNSHTISQGMVAIAVGSPLGTNYSILTGNITSTVKDVSTIDNNYTVLTTNIVGSSRGSGAIINMAGEVIGLVMQDYSNAAGQNTLTALAISDLKAIIEMISNNQDIPYIGLKLTTVTNEISGEYDIPKGAYVKEVKMDSPAMAAGLQNGDVITGMNGEPIYTVEGYETRLLKLIPGESVEIKVQRQGAEGYTEIVCDVNVSILQ